jgi:hypothetical protein
MRSQELHRAEFSSRSSRKAVSTFRGIQMLKSERLIEESWILLRALLEVHINLIYFLKNDGTEMTRRWSDAAMLDKLS